ncbi:MAG: hypothetical protein RSB55_04240 [Oscillospiraceae bacterium]
MVGVLSYGQWQPRVTLGTMGGLLVRRVSVPREGLLAQSRLRRAAKSLAACGVTRVLVPEDFADWDVLSRRGLAPVDPMPFLQALAPELALFYLAGQGILPENATVALRGERVTGGLYAAAVKLCPKVAHLVIEAPHGGGELSLQLERTMGLAQLPPGTRGDLALCFSPGFGGKDEPEIGLYPGGTLRGMSLQPRALTLPEDCRGLPFLALLWETGLVTEGDLRAVSAETA